MENSSPGLTTPAKVLIAVLAVILVLLTQFFILPQLGFGSGKEMIIEGTGYGDIYDFSSGAAFHSNDSRNYYFATREGIRYISSNNVLQWSDSFIFTNPWMATRGDFVAIGEERGGKTIHVYNTSGSFYSITIDDPILAYWVNETGFLSVIAQYEGGYGVYVFNEFFTNEPLYLWTEFDNLIQPTYAEVSPDGTYIAIAVLDLTFNVTSSVQFRYMNQWDAWGTNKGWFATEYFPEQLITELRFMNGNRLIVATTSQIVCFQLGPGHSVSRRIWGIQLENVKSHIDFYNGTHFAYITGERLPLTTEEGDPIGTVHIYGINGQPTGRFELGRRATHLRMGHNSVIIGGDRSFHAVDFRGNPIWEHTFLFDIRDVRFLDNVNTILVAGSNQVEVFERRRVRENDNSGNDEGAILP